MPVVIGAQPALPSAPQYATTVVLFDYETTPDGQAFANAEIIVWLGHDKATLGAPAVVLESKRIRVVTDPNGFWQMNLVSNSLITPAGTYYAVRTPQRTYRTALPAGAGP